MNKPNHLAPLLFIIGCLVSLLCLGIAMHSGRGIEILDCFLLLAVCAYGFLHTIDEGAEETGDEDFWS